MLKIESYLKQQIDATLQKLSFPHVTYQFDRPRLEAHGDISINVAMILAKSLKQNPREIANQIVTNLELKPETVEKVEIAGPGFINFFLSPEVLRTEIREILKQKEEYGKFFLSPSPKALVEFVSANPTGPLTVGHGRQAVLGDTIANILEWNGFTVTREYYFNNAGRQMRVLADSVRLRYLELLGETIEFPEDYYQGEYIKDIARKILETHGDSLKDSTDLTIFKETAEQEIFEDIKATLASLNIVFDSFVNELDLYEKGEVDFVIETFKSKNLAYEKDGALWFKTTEFGLEQDRVIVKSTGEPTYRLPDIAYHKYKFDRGFDLMVDIFGADHIATYPDVLAGLKALGYDTERVKVLIHQFVTLFEGKEKVKMSTRKATFITLDELVQEVGKDATRWFFLMRGMKTHLNFDLQLAKTQSDENPVYYNQYAHARICSILRNASDKGISLQDNPSLNLLKHPAEFQLMKKLMEFPRIVEKCRNEFEPQPLTQYLSEVSTAFHKFYTECRVISEEEPELTQARLKLCLATKQVLANGFTILGISAPEKM
ncbi:MAG: arginine--tRNA ligase [Calditrichaeota bacterium]|nr:MAG: arginine--tRNA ligase [Calditrichota bacterium]